MKNKFVHNCRFVHHAKFHCNMTMLYNLFKIDFERGGGKLEKSPDIFGRNIANLGRFGRNIVLFSNFTRACGKL